MNKKELIRTIKFTLFSISAGVIELVSFALLNEFTSFGYWICYLTALILSVVWNFTLNREFTFKSTANVPVAMFKVFIFYLIFTPTSTILGDYLVNKLNFNEYIVTILNMLCNFVLEYLYDKYIVFRGKIDTKVKNKEEVWKKYFIY